MTSENHLTEGPSDFMNWSSSWYVTTLTSLLAIVIVVVQIFLACHVIKQDHMIKGSGDYNNKSSSR